MNRQEGKILVTNLPAQGVTTLTKQKDKKRFIHHLLYASPVHRGKNVEVIEDILPVFNTYVKLAIDAPVKAVTFAPQMADSVRF